MSQLLAQHSILAICLIVTLEEANIPLPVPGDLLLLYAGAMSAHAPGLFAWWLLLLTVVPSFGSYALYAVVRRGGRPLIERYGRYFALGPRELARSEALFRRYGWGGIAIGRSVPVLRHAVLIACGVLDVPPRSFLAGQLLGGLLNTLLFMLLGALVGPTVIESFHLPRQAVRLGELLLLAVGLPLVLRWLYRRARSQMPNQPVAPSLVGTLLASAAGAVALCATWAALVVGVALLGQPVLPGIAALAGTVVGRGLPADLADVVLFSALLALSAGLGLATAPLLRPASDGQPVLWRDLGLLSLAMAAVLALLLGVAGAWQPGDAALLALVLGVSCLAFAVTTVYGRALAAAVAAGARPWQPQPATKPAEPSSSAPDT